MIICYVKWKRSMSAGFNWSSFPIHHSLPCGDSWPLVCGFWWGLGKWDVAILPSCPSLIYTEDGTGAILKIFHLIDTFFNTLLWTRQWRETNNQQEEIKCYFFSEKELSRMRMLGFNWLLSWFSYLSKFTHLIKFSKLMLTNYFVSTKFVVRGCQMKDEQLKI